CVMRDPPDGYVCAQASPCQGEGRCTGSTCVRPDAHPLLSSWDYDSALVQDPDGGQSAQQYRDLVLEPQGAVSLMGFFQAPPKLRANTNEPHVGLEGPTRRCMLWN